MNESAGRGWRLVRASTDAVPASLRRMFQARRRRISRRTVLIVATALALVLLAGWALWGTSLVSVREVRVTGVEILTPAEVRSAAAVPERTPLLRVPTGEVADRVARLAPVAEVRVSRAWPDALVIEIVERVPAAAVPVGEEFQLVDATGVGFQTVSRRPDGLPVLTVAEPGPHDPATLAALEVLAALTGRLREELESITARGATDIELELSSGWTVVWGDARDSQAKAQVATALLERDDTEGSVIDVSAPEVVSVR